MMGRKPTIQEISPEEAEVIIETRQPLGLFYVKESGVYVGIDNSCGDAWTEDFSSLDQCKRWLGNPNIEKEDKILRENHNGSSLFSDVVTGAEAGAAIGKCITGIAGTIAGGLTGAVVGYLRWLVGRPLSSLDLLEKVMGNE